jgi:formate hydrogenlyase subunit 4
MLSFILILISAFFFPGIILKTKSFFSGRQGPGILQPMKDIYLLFRKGSVFSDTTGIIFQIAPSISFISLLCASLLIPLGDNSVISFEGDFVLFAYLLAAGRFFSIIGALDTGSSFEGMGASREALYAMLLEPAFFILVGMLSLLTGYISFQDIFNNIHFSGGYYYLIGIIAIYLIIQITMVENCRLPVDDPKTHLELTMIHEVMVLDNSGFDLALINISSALKFSVFGALIANFIIPAGISIVMQIGLFFVIESIFAVIAGSLESFRARNRMTNNPQFILTLSAIGLFGFMLVLIITGKLFH